MKQFNNFFKGNNGFKNIVVLLLVMMGALLILQQLVDMTRNVVTISYSTFLDKLDKHEVRQIYVEGQDIRGVLKNNTVFQTVAPEHALNWEKLSAKGVEFSVANQSEYGYYWYIILFMLALIGIMVIWFMVRQSRGMGGSSNIFTMGKSRARMFMPSTIKENFNSVAGAQEAKEELQDIVDYLRNPKKYRRLGAKMTRGVLLIGEPGNGKTLLAKAVAGEANCPFFSVSGSEFIEVFVGVGSARVRDLFAQARKHAPSIIFIDEIDAVGRHRGPGLSGGHDEREQTLNQLLTEMDGFATGDTSVIVIGATNRADVLDKALLRPGRFDLQVQVPYPDLKSREEILKVHIKDIKVDDSVDLGKLARGTPGFSGADLANLINEAAKIASKTDHEYVTMHHFEEARDKLMLGKKLTSITLTEEDKKVIAYHESGHALTRLLMPDYADPLHKVSIIPHTKGALGVTHHLPEREKYIISKQELEASVISALGGRVAEEIVFDRLTTGAYSDFKGATEIVRKMVCDYGMVPQDLSTVLYGQLREGEFRYSQKTAEKIDDAVRTIMDYCLTKTRQMLVEHRDKLDTLAKALLEKETMYAAEIYELLGIESRAEHRLV